MTAPVSTVTIWHGREVKAVVESVAMDALEIALNNVLGAAVQVTPHKSGTLRRSGVVTMGEREGYIGFSTPYARYQHEGLELRHTDGQAKYLETPFAQRQAAIPPFIEKRVQAALRSKGG